MNPPEPSFAEESSRFSLVSPGEVNGSELACLNSTAPSSESRGKVSRWYPNWEGENVSTSTVG